jgi:hypothetical protein
MLEMVFQPQDNNKCWIIVKSAKIFLLMQQTKIQKANKIMISIQCDEIHE